MPTAAWIANDRVNADCCSVASRYPSNSCGSNRFEKYEFVAVTRGFPPASCHVSITRRSIGFDTIVFVIWHSTMPQSTDDVSVALPPNPRG